MLMPNDFFPPFSEQEYVNRRRTIQASMKEKGLDCLIVYGAYHWGGTDTGQVWRVSDDVKWRLVGKGMPAVLAVLPLA